MVSVIIGYKSITSCWFSSWVENIFIRLYILRPRWEKSMFVAKVGVHSWVSQNHRMVGFGRDLCGSPSPTPCRSRVTYSRLHRTLSRRVLNISREGDSTTSLGSLFQCSVTLRGKKSLLKICCQVAKSFFQVGFTPLRFGLCQLPVKQICFSLRENKNDQTKDSPALMSFLKVLARIV